MNKPVAIYQYLLKISSLIQLNSSQLNFEGTFKTTFKHSIMSIYLDVDLDP